MDLTTIDRLVELFGEKNYKPEFAGVLGNIISGVSAEIERHLRRHVQSASRTVNIDVERHDDAVFLKGYPISAVANIWNDPSRDFASGTLVDTDLYYVNLPEGEISFDFELDWGPGALRIEYTGGMADDVDDFIDTYPDIVLAVDQQCFYEWQRRDDPGVVTRNPTDFGGGATLLVSEDWGRRFGELQPKVVKMLEDYVCKARAW